eukprot:4972740-Lingulodinium_polyedra.AAC.1
MVCDGRSVASQGQVADEWRVAWAKTLAAAWTTSQSATDVAGREVGRSRLATPGTVPARWG